LKVLLADGESQIAGVTLNLVRGCCPYGGIKGDVSRLAVSGPRLDVPAPPAIGPGIAAPPALAAGQLIEVGVEPPLDFELRAGFDFFATFPPARSIVILE
jgi:hypothetical protein